MSAPDDSHDPLAEHRRLLEGARRLRTWSPAARAATWHALSRRIGDAHPRSRTRWSWLNPNVRHGLELAGIGLATFAVIFVLGTSLRRALELDAVLPNSDAAWAQVALGGDDALRVEPGAVYGVEQLAAAGGTERRVELTAGAVEASVRKRTAGDAFSVVTPHLRAVVVGTRFTVRTSQSRSLVQVTEGRVRVEAPTGRAVLLGAGESITSDDPRLRAPSPEVARTDVPATTPALPQLSAVLPPSPAPSAAARHATERTACRTEPEGSARTACLERLASGTGLAAQNALYALGLRELGAEGDPLAARRHLERYRVRFPHGVFAPEVSLALLDLHLRAGASAAALPEALAEAAHFLRAHGDDPRAEDIQSLHTQLMKLSQTSRHVLPNHDTSQERQ